MNTRARKKDRLEDRVMRSIRRRSGGRYFAVRANEAGWALAANASARHTGRHEGIGTNWAWHLREDQDEQVH